MPDVACLFCKIASGVIPADVVDSDDRMVAFRDISPQAPVHVLIIPREHLTSVDAAESEHAELLGAMLLMARQIAKAEGLSERGYRLVANTGRDGGQTVHHLHIHLLGGRAMQWPPG